MKNQKTAILLGGTGLTGSLLLHKLIADPTYTSIKLFSRRESGINSPKVREYVVDLFQMEKYKEAFTADEVFCCIGTTSAKTSDRDIYRAIDYGIPVTASRLARENKIQTFIVMSSLGANPRSRIFYSRTKGEMEEAVLAQNIPHTYILRPSLISGKRKEKRFGESAGAILLKMIQVFLQGRFRKYRSIEAGCIADAMMQLARTLPDIRIVPSDIIHKLGNDS